MRIVFATLVVATLRSTAAFATEFYPLDRATILVKSPFDFRVELDAQHPQAEIAVSVNGKSHAEVFGKAANFEAAEKGEADLALGSAPILRDLTLDAPGSYHVKVKARAEIKAVTWEVYTTEAAPKAKKVIFISGDGLSVARRTAARVMD